MCYRKNCFATLKDKHNMVGQTGVLEISRSRIKANLALFRNRLPKHTLLCATVKANAYGHGVEQVVPVLREAGIDWFCVYSLGEAARILRSAESVTRSTHAKVLVLAPVVLREGARILPESLALLATGQVRVNLADVASAMRLAKALSSGGATQRIPIHVQIDTGLTRGGVTGQEALRLIEKIETLPQLELEGLFSHLSHGDVPRHETVEKQVARLHAVADPIKKRREGRLLIHLQNSGGAWHIADGGLDMVRLGIGLYGLQPSTADSVKGLLPIARLVAPILAIHERDAGIGVGYSHAFITTRRSRLAIVPVGYGDGYPRRLSSHGLVQIRGQQAPVVGRVSMDQIVIDVTDILNAEIGDELIVVSNEFGAPNSVDVTADALGTIGYEITTGWGERLQRKIVD